MSSLNSQDSVPTAEANFAILLTYVRGLRTERSFRCLPVIPSLNSQDSVPTAVSKVATLMTYVRGLRTERSFFAYNGSYHRSYVPYASRAGG